MSTYFYTPKNFSKVDKYFITDKKIVYKKLLVEEPVYVYDTCSFLHHARSKRTPEILELLKLRGNTILLFRTILMELAGDSGILLPEVIAYIGLMNTKGFGIILLDEEESLDILFSIFGKSEGLMNNLVNVVDHSVLKDGKISELKTSNQLKNLHTGSIVEREKTIKEIIVQARNAKEHEDNLGEDMICLTCHLLSVAPTIKKIKYIILTDDKGGIAQSKRVSDNVTTQFPDKNTIGVRSSNKIVADYYDELRHTYSEDETNARFEPWARDVLFYCGIENITVMITETYDMKPREKKKTVEELILAIENGATVYS